MISPPHCYAILPSFLAHTRTLRICRTALRGGNRFDCKLLGSGYLLVIRLQGLLLAPQRSGTSSNRPALHSAVITRIFTTFKPTGLSTRAGASMLSRRLPDPSILSRQQHQARSSLAAVCSPQQQWPAQSNRFDRSIARFQAQHEQQPAAETLQQEVASTSARVQQAAVAVPRPAVPAARHGKAAAALCLLAALQSKWQQLAVWCRQHRVQQLLWG